MRDIFCGIFEILLKKLCLPPSIYKENIPKKIKTPIVRTPSEILKFTKKEIIKYNIHQNITINA